MTARYPHFLGHITRAKDLVGLGQSFATMTHGAVDASDMYRAGLVQAVAAMDHYFHGVILDRGVDILLGRLAPGASSKVGVSFEGVRQILASPTAADRELAARAHLASRLGLETFQRAEAIGTGLALVGVPKVWSTVFGSAAGPTMTALNVIVDRRNRIVHQADSDPLTPGSVTPLSAADAADAVATTESIVGAIDPSC